MKLTLTRKHHLVTEKYGHLDIEATIELDSLHENATPEAANLLLDLAINPSLEQLNRSLDQPGDEEFVRAWVNSREV